ncbi:carboxymuconolactone decarboxylase family protein [Pseudactinotalea suaedae]|uniref:carboxymuconolactone decarboxylase family protein n=1 Tax=Pseudactinotalea suaedae TaxID=1524924 RepID=UPI0012E0F257|nr:peroxidase [Pseudactinotalea suaedae]
MAFVDLPDPATFVGAAAGIVDADRAAMGYVPTYDLVMAQRPGVNEAWKQLASAVRDGAGMRRYELATLGAARGLRSSYCSLAHGKLLAERVLGEQGLRRVLDGEQGDGVDDVDLAVVAFADKVGRGGADITATDVDELRAAGLDDGEIVDVVLAAAARCFFSTVLDSLGLQPDAAYRESVPESVRDDLVVGRPIAED